MADAPLEKAAGIISRVTTTSDNGDLQRNVLYGQKTTSSGQSRVVYESMAVPNWFDLPVLLPESNPMAARIQSDEASPSLIKDQVKKRESGRTSVVPKVSRLGFSSREEEEKHKAKKMGGAVMKSTIKRRKVAMVKKLDELRWTTNRKDRLREKLWKDIRRFGLWSMAGPWDIDSQQSMQNTVNAIWTQWQDNAARTLSWESDGNQSSNYVGIRYDGVDSHVEETDEVFLTRVPSVVMNSSTLPVNESERQLSVITDTGTFDALEENESDDGNDKEYEEPSHISRLQAKIQTPGLRRRKRLSDLHHFVGIQLQKRLFRSWDAIEVAFRGSEELPVSQVIKLLQHSDVQLGVKDAAKVQKILDDHVVAKLSAKGSRIDENYSDGKRSKSKAVISYEGFRQIFHPVDSEEASRWKRDFEREKLWEKQEKEIYNKELAALEIKVRQRLANSAKQMVDILQQFECNPRTLPWENEQQRLLLRSQFLEIIFSKSHRKPLLQDNNGGLPHPDPTESPKARATYTIPNKLSVRLLLPALLQKYSRNGHFESIEVSVAAYLYHDYAVDVIKQGFRRYQESLEMNQWPERQIIMRFRMKKKLFHEWRKFCDRADILRKHVLRKFIAWKYMTRKLHEYYEFYRISFWPFYVWKRHLQQMIIAHGKAFLLTNIVQTYIQLRNFRALKQRYLVQKRNWSHIARMQGKRAKRMRMICWSSWKDRYQSFRSIRQIWRSHGKALQHHNRYYMVRVTFYVLRYYSILKGDMHRRKFKSFLSLHSVSARAKPISRRRQHQHVSTPTSSSKHNQNGQQHGRYVPIGNMHNTGSPPRQNIQAIAYEPRQHTNTSRNNRNSSSINDENSVGSFPVHVHNDDHHADASDGYPTTSLTRIMETELGTKLKRKSRLYDLCLSLYLEYRERDRRNMIGNVIAYRRLGRVLLMCLQTVVRNNKKNRFATELGAFRVMLWRFRQWKISTVSKELSVAPRENAEVVENDGGLGNSREKVALHWCEDRDWRLQGIMSNPILAEKLCMDLTTIRENILMRKEDIRGRDLLLGRQQFSEDAFLRREASFTSKLIAAQMRQVQQMMRRRAHRLHDAMDNVYDVLLQQQAAQQLRSSFRSLRIVVMMKHTSSLCHRTQIRNWIRLCRRLIYWEEHMDKFYQLKTKYRAFQTLLKHAVCKYKFQSPGLSQKLRRSGQLMQKYERFLKERGAFRGTSKSTNLTALNFLPANSFRGVFLRWVQFTQSSKARQAIVGLVRKKQQLWSMYTVFLAIKYRVKVKYTFKHRRAHLPCLWKQSMADLDTYHCKIITLEKQMLTTRLRKKMTCSRQLKRQTAISSPTLKKLIQDHEKEVRLRLQLEKRLMLVAYSNRGVHSYAERSSSLFGTAAGQPFVQEKASPFGSISKVYVIHSTKVDGISLAFRVNGNNASLEGTLYGNAYGDREVFSLSRDEKLISVEGFASQSLYGLRFGTSTGRYSKWFGHCEKGLKFEICSDFIEKREEIVGFFGHADSSSIHALGVVTRYTTLQNPFEGLWVQNDSYSQLQQSPTRSLGDDLPLCDRQFAYFLQVRACEVMRTMQRVQQFALQAYRMEGLLPPALGNIRIIMALARWMLTALSHGLVHCTEREEEGQQLLQSGHTKCAAGEKLLHEGNEAMDIVKKFRDSAGQLDAATLGVKKLVELREMMNRAQEQIAQGQQLKDEGQSQIKLSQTILPRLPTTKRMLSAIHKMYEVVQTKHEIDQMAPELRSILLFEKTGGGLPKND